MSFLADPPMLVATGALIERFVHDERSARSAEVAVLAAYVGVSGGLYLEARWTEPMWRALGAQSGRDWMINSGVFSFPADDAGPATHALALAIFATYPLWLRLGRRLARARP